MKKIYCLFLQAILLTLCGFTAQAADPTPDDKVTFTWDVPGSVQILTASGDLSTAVEIDPEATEVTLPIPSGKYYYVKAAAGYFLTNVVNTFNESVSRPTTYGAFPQCAISLYSQENTWNKTFKVNVEKLTIDGSFGLNIVNGADKITLKLNNTDNQIAYSETLTPALGETEVSLCNMANQLVIGGNGVKTLYKVTKNGEAVESSSAYYINYAIPVANGDQVEITVYEPGNEPVPATLSVAFEGLGKDALRMIFNRTASKTVQLDAEGKATVTKGDELQVSLNFDDYNPTVLLNGADYDLTTAADMGYFRFTVDGDTELSISATEKEFGEVQMPFYTNNIEAFTFTTEYMGGEEMTLEYQGETEEDLQITSSITMPKGTKIYLATFSAKENRFFYSLKPGYFASTAVYCQPEDPDYPRLAGECIEYEAGPVYIVAEKIDYSATAVVFYEGPENNGRLTSSDASTMPAPYEGQTQYLAEGYTTIKFDPAYNTSFSARGFVLTDEVFSLYLNGQALSPDENGVFAFGLTDGSVVKAFNAAEAPAATTVNFTLEEGATAEVTYDKIAKYTDFSAPLKSYGPTEVTITPAEGYSVKVGGEAVELTNGSYTWLASGAVEVAIEKEAVAPAAPLVLLSTAPADGAVKKSFSKVMFEFEQVFEGYTWYNISLVSEDAYKQVTVTTPEGEIIPSTGPCEFMGDSEGFPFQFEFPEQTAAGEYTVTLPAGILAQSQYDQDADAFLPIANARVNEEVKIKITVDPSVPAAIEKYTLNPADGAKVRALAKVVLAFPEAADLSTTYGWGEPTEYPTLSNGTTSYKMLINQEYGAPQFTLVAVETVHDDEYDYDQDQPVSIKEAGEWTLHVPAGLFSSEDISNSVIEATYTVDPTAPITYTATPANGSSTPMKDVEYGHVVKFAFNGMQLVTYDAVDPMAGIRMSYNGKEIAYNEALADDWENTEDGWCLQEWKEDDEVSILISALEFTAPGTLKISIDEGRFTVDGEASPEISYEATVGEIKSYSHLFTPQTGTEVADLKVITISFPEAETGAFNPDEAYIILQGPSTIYPIDPEVEAVEGAEVPTFTLTFPLWGESFLARPGNYSLTIGEGTFVLDGDQRCEDISGYWIVKNDDVDLSWTASPETDLANEGYGVFVSFVFDQLVSVGHGNQPYSSIKVTFQGKEIPYNQPAEEGGAYFMCGGDSYSPNLFMINAFGGVFDDEKASGEFNVVIPAGTLTANGQDVPEINYTWNVIGKKEYTVNVTPAPDTTVESLKEFTVEFEGAKTIAINDEYGYQVSLRSNDYTTYPSARASSIEVVEGTEWATVKVVFENEATAVGKYTFSLSYGAFKLDNAFDTTNYNFVYEIAAHDGIEGIAADENGLFTVFNLAGVVVLKDAEADAVRNLPAGFYIVNGQKVFVK